MAGYEDIRAERSHLIQHMNPRHTVSARHIWKFFGEENFTQISNPVLRDEQNAVSLRMRCTEIQNLNFLAAKIQGHAIPERRVRHPGALFFSRSASALHLVEKAGPIVVVSDLENIRIREIPFAERVVERRGNEIAYRLLDHTRNRFALRARRFF